MREIFRIAQTKKKNYLSQRGLHKILKKTYLSKNNRLHYKELISKLNTPGVKKSLI